MKKYHGIIKTLKVQGPGTLLKERLWHRYFPVNFAKFLRTPFLQNTSGDCFCIYCQEETAYQN